LPIRQNHLQLSQSSAALDAALREQNFGVIDGMRVDDIKAQHADAWAQWIRFDADYAFTGGESTRQFHARVHGGVLDMIYRTALALPLSGPRQSDIPNAGLNRVRIQGEAIEILDWADARHLADMPAQPVYDQTRVAASDV
jgi:probable phosphoglycerate mutase